MVPESFLWWGMMERQLLGIWDTYGIWKLSALPHILVTTGSVRKQKWILPLRSTPSFFNWAPPFMFFKLSRQGHQVGTKLKMHDPVENVSHSNHNIITVSNVFLSFENHSITRVTLNNFIWVFTLHKHSLSCARGIINCRVEFSTSKHCWFPNFYFSPV